MQGVEGPDRELWDAGEVVGHLVGAGSMFAFLAEHRGEVFPDEDYADLFAAGVGRPSLPATRMAAVLTLQALHDLSDRECAEAVRCDLRGKVACGLSLLDEGFDPSSLVYWRKRIAKSDRPHRGQRRDPASDRGDRGAARSAPPGGGWTPRSLMTRWPPRTRSPS
ncbi:MAG: transposase [Pseudonocardiaceae bacterium]